MQTIFIKDSIHLSVTNEIQEIYISKQSFTGVLWKRCSEKMRQIYRITAMLKCDFSKVVSQFY